MISKIIFKKITFINLKTELFNKIITKKGFFVFYLKSEGSGVLPRISEWWHRCSGSLSLPQLIGARLVQVGSDTDDIIYREKNDRLWATQ